MREMDATEVVELVRSLADDAPSRCDADGVAAAIARCARLSGWLEARRAAFLTRAVELNRQGDCGSAADVLTDVARLSVRDARHAARRAELIREATRFAEAVASGAVSTGH